MDCDSVYLVNRIGYPTSLIEFVQEMGHCGRNRENTIIKPVDKFHIVATLSDYVYLYERLFYTTDCDNETNGNILSVEEKRELGKKHLLSMLQLITNTNSCWHKSLEYHCANPLDNDSVNPPCGNACPYCNDTMSHNFMPVKRDGLTLFLVDTFINMPSSTLSPSLLVDKLKTYPDVGTKVYCWQRSSNCPSSKYIEGTIMQLIACEIIKMHVIEDNGKAICTLYVFNNGTEPAYLNDSSWVNMLLDNHNE